MNYSAISPKLSPSFNGTFLIPFDQIKNKGAQSSQTMRNIGYETSKFTKDMNNIMQTKDGMVVKIDDGKDAEFQAVIAKYGINIKRVNIPIENNNNPELHSYKFMITKLNPNDAEKKINEYLKLDKISQHKEFQKVYIQYKNSPHSIEKNMNTKTN